MKKISRFLIVMLCFSFIVVLAACGKEADTDSDPIEGSWRASSIIDAEGVVTPATGSPEEPKLECTDTAAVFTNNSRPHMGTWTKNEDGTYTISYSDTDSVMTGEISDDVLTLHVGKMTIKFKKE